jgi:hypothetical protein
MVTHFLAEIAAIIRATTGDELKAFGAGRGLCLPKSFPEI